MLKGTDDFSTNKLVIYLQEIHLSSIRYRSFFDTSLTSVLAFFFFCQLFKPSPPAPSFSVQFISAFGTQKYTIATQRKS